MATSTAEKPVKPGRVILARHGEPGLSRKIRFNAAGYRDWWAKYEKSSPFVQTAVPPSGAAAHESVPE